MTLTSRGYCHNSVDHDTKIHFDVAICITPDELRSFKLDEYKSWDRILFDTLFIPGMIISMLHENVQGKCFMCYLITQGLSFMAQILDCYALCHLRHLSLHISMLFSLAQRDSVRRLVEFTEFQVSQALQRTMYYATSNN